MATTYIVSVTTTADPAVVTVKVTKGLSVVEEYDAPASVLSGDTPVRNLVRLSRLGLRRGVGVAPIKAK